MTKNHKHIFAALAMSTFVFALSGCEKPAGPAERAGEKIDNAAQKAGQQVEKAGEKIQDAAKDAKN
jgi:hypothetical protein